MVSKNIIEENVVLDASAIIALLAQETGSEKVAQILPHAIISSVNFAEVAKYLIEHKSYSTEQVSQTMKSLLPNVISFDEEQALLNGDLINKVKALGLSLADRACITLGIKLKAPIYTADKIWAKLKLDGANIRLIR